MTLEVVWVPPAAGAPEPILKAFLSSDGAMRKYCAYHRTDDGRRYFLILDREENRELVSSLGPAWVLKEDLDRQDKESRERAEAEAEAARLALAETERLEREEAERIAREAEEKAKEEAASKAREAIEIPAPIQAETTTPSEPPIETVENKRKRAMDILIDLHTSFRPNMRLETLVQLLPEADRGAFL